MLATNIDFLPADYQPIKQNKGYMRLEQGENKIRILSKPLRGIEEWVNKKPKRTPAGAEFIPDPQADGPGREFWSFIVYNYTEKQIQILNLTQKSIHKAIASLCKDADWGAPYFYDIKIIKRGATKEDTEYLVNPLPHKQVSEEIIKLFNNKPICLEALYEGTDPFSALHHRYTPGIFNRNAEIELKPVQQQQALPWEDEHDN